MLRLGSRNIVFLSFRIVKVVKYSRHPIEQSSELLFCLYSLSSTMLSASFENHWIEKDDCSIRLEQPPMNICVVKDYWGKVSPLPTMSYTFSLLYICYQIDIELTLTQYRLDLTEHSSVKFQPESFKIPIGVSQNSPTLPVLTHTIDFGYSLPVIEGSILAMYVEFFQFSTVINNVEHQTTLSKWPRKSPEI